MIAPRDYQIAGHAALIDQVHARPDQNPLVVMATGLGKSISIAMFAYDMLVKYPHVRIMNVTHVKELVEGNYNALKKLWPAAPAGVYSAGLNMRETRSQITYAGIASVAKRAATFGHIDFLVVDEAHRIGPKDQATYGNFIKELKQRNPHLIVIGFTATAFRMGMGMLTDGELFDVEAFNLGFGESFIWAIENGYLSKLVPKNPGFEINESEIAIIAGDYDSKSASQAMHDQNILERAVDLTIATGVEQNRLAWLTFCQSIEDTELVADMFQYKGYDIQPVHSKRNDRDLVLKDFKAGKLRGVTNQNVLTTGFDHPGIDLIAMLRLTRSPGLWIQMLGRGTRPVFAPGYDLNTLEGRLAASVSGPKQSCLCLDFCGNTARLGPINYPTVAKKRGAKSGPPPVRECPQCATYLHISIKICTECGYEFPPPKRIEASASKAELIQSRAIDLNSQPKPKEYGVFPVDRIICSQNVGRNERLDTMRVDYFSGLRRFSTWVCLNHAKTSFPRTKAEQWWRKHSSAPVPVSVEKALALSADLVKPKYIKVWVNTKYEEVVDYDFRGTQFNLPPEFGGPPIVEVAAQTSATDQAARWARSYADSAGNTYDNDEIPF